MLPLHHQPMIRGSYGLLALDFTLMTVLATHASLSFPPRWSGILESNQEPQTYQVCAPTNCANARKLPLCQPLYVTGHRETDSIFYISKLTLYLTLLYVEFSSQGCISFQLAWARDCRHPSAPCSHSHIGWISYYQ